MACQMRIAHRNAHAIAATRKRTHDISSDKARTTEHGDERRDLGNGGHLWLSDCLFCRFLVVSQPKAKGAVGRGKGDHGPFMLPLGRLAS